MGLAVLVQHHPSRAGLIPPLLEELAPLPVQVVPTYAGSRVSRYREPTTLEQALSEALYLGLVAPGDEEAQAAAMLAEDLAQGMDEATVEMCKAHALERFEADEG